MCLIVFAHRVSPDLPLVLAANRDEFFQRPTRQAHIWQDDSGQELFVAGKDLQAGGTWLGIARDGRFATVTNIRDPSQAENKPRSRGELALNFLSADVSATVFASSLEGSMEEYAGFNLLLGDSDGIVYINNSEKLIRQLEPGIYGLSNGLLGAAWPKITRARDSLAQLMALPQPPTIDQLIALMNDRELAQDEALPDTGLPRELERQLSSPFITNSSRNYGTLCSTALILESGGRIHFNEQNYNEDGQATESHYFRFN